MRFEWDRDKAESNLKKHGVSFDEAVTVFYDPLSATFDDPDHPEDEPRLITLGYPDQDLEPDVAKAFRSSAAVNEALRCLLEMSESTRRLTTRSGGRAKTARRG